MIAIVSGFQRCGSSLMLQMLAAGGMPIFHDREMGYPSFETRLQTSAADDPAWLNAIDGHAVKWLEPLDTFPSPKVKPDLRVLWMKRDYREQGKSAVKFMRACGAIVAGGAARRMAASYRHDEPAARLAWARRGRIHTVRFETLLSQPRAVALAVTTFLSVPLDVDRMAAQVRQRSAACLPHMLEVDLIEQGDGRER